MVQAQMIGIKERPEFEAYQKVKLLGEGSFGKAFLVRRVKDSLMCVMKMIDIGRMAEREKKETLQEARLLEAFSHPNIVTFIEVFKTKKGKLCILMDYCDGGDLQGRMKQQKGRAFSENQILDWFTQICLGMKHIHDRKVIHRDLKGQNIFMTKQGFVKIGDLGIAKVLSQTLQKARTCVGTPYYLSPEIVQSQPYTFSTDIWSMGVMLYEMAALRPPFDAPSLHMLSMKIVRGAFTPVSSNFSTGLRKLISDCLAVTPSRRPTVNAILKLPLIQNRIKTNLSTSVVANEFSHTVLHRQDVYSAAKQVPKSNAVDNKSPAATPSPSSAYPSQAQVVARNQQNKSYLPQPKPAANYQNLPRFQQVNAAMGRGGAGAGVSPRPSAQPNIADLNRRPGANAPVRGQPPANGRGGAVAPQANQNYHYRQQEERKKEEEARAAQQKINQMKAARVEREVQARRDYEAAAKKNQRRDLDRMVEQEMAQQKKDDEARAHRKKMELIDNRLKQKQDALKQMEAQDAMKRADQRRVDQERAQNEAKRNAVADKKNQEVQRELELMKARREAYEERLALKAKQEARKKAEEQERLDDVERRNAMERLAAKRDGADQKRKDEERKQQDRRRAAEEATHAKQQDVLAKRAAREAAAAQADEEKKRKRAAERDAWINEQKVKRDAEKDKREERKRQNQIELERIRAERERRANEQEEIKKIQQQNPQLKNAVDARGGASMYKKPAVNPHQNAEGLSSIQKMAWGAHDKIFGMAADIGQHKNQNPVPQTEEGFYSKAKQKEALAEVNKLPEDKQGSIKNQRDQDRAQMIKDMKAKAKKGKKQPAFEIVDMPEEERIRGEQVAAYQAKKAEEAALQHQSANAVGIARQAQQKAPAAAPKQVARPAPRAVEPVIEVNFVESVKSRASQAKEEASDDNDGDDGDGDRDDPFDSDVTSEEDEDDLNAERETDSNVTQSVYEETKQQPSAQIQQEMEQQEKEAHDLINEELAMSGTDALDVLPGDSVAGGSEQISQNPDDYVGDQAYQMYQELLDIVRSGDEPEADTTSASDVSRAADNYHANMNVIAEESETEYPSFSQKRKPKHGGDDEFDAVIDNVLAENRDVSPGGGVRRDDFSSDDDDDLSPARGAGNPLKDFTFVGGDMTLVPKKEKPKPKKLDSVAAIRDYLETELTQQRLYQAYPILRDFGDDILYEEKSSELIEKLEFCMSEQEVLKYRNFFALLIFHDQQVDQDGGGEEAMLKAGQTLRGISNMTAAFGSAPLKETMPKY